MHTPHTHASTALLAEAHTHALSIPINNYSYYNYKH